MEAPSFAKLKQVSCPIPPAAPVIKIILSYYRRNLFRNGKFEEGLAVYQKETGVIELDDDKINIK